MARDSANSGGAFEGRARVKPLLPSLTQEGRIVAGTDATAERLPYPAFLTLPLLRCLIHPPCLRFARSACSTYPIGTSCAGLGRRPCQGGA